MSISDRMKEFIKSEKLSVSAFEKSINASNGYVNSMVKGIGTDKAKLILELYPKFDLVWVLTGKHDEAIPESDYTKAPIGRFEKKKDLDMLVPFYNIDFAAGNDLILVDNANVTPDYYMDVPEFSGCTAFKAYSDSMENLIKSGNILFGTKVEEWQLHLEYGQIYGIICNDGRRYLKYIRKFIESPKEYFLLKSENENYDDFEMPKKAIRSIWLIHGWLNKRT